MADNLVIEIVLHRAKRAMYIELKLVCDSDVSLGAILVRASVNMLVGTLGVDLIT